MKPTRGPALLRLIAVVLIRGRDGMLLRAELEEAYVRDRGRGLPSGRAYRRYLVNVLGSAISVWRSRLRLPRFSISGLDVKLGLRMLVKHPGLTAVSVFALAIGIPVGLVPTWLADAVEAPFPHPDAERIQALRYWDLETSQPESATWYDFQEWSRELRSFEALGVVRTAGYNVAADGRIGTPVMGAEVTASTFDILRARALHGRVLFESDQSIGGPAVVVIGYDLWRARFGGAPDIVGRDIRIAGVPHTVVGVMPEGFLFPVHQQIWLPIRERAASEPGTGIGLRVFGRLADGVSPDEANAELVATGRRMALEFPEAYDRLQAEVVRLPLMFIAFPRGGVRAMPWFYLAQGLSLVLLFVACINVALLIFARTATRSSELAVRSAIGASRARIVSQVFTECLVLAVVAAGFGLLLLGSLPRLLPARMAAAVPYWIDFGLSPRTILFALTLAAFSAAAAGVLPALRVTGKSVQRSIQRARAGRSGIRFGGVSSALVAIDVALSVAVIGFAIGVTDTLREAWDAQGTTVGFPDHEYLSAQLMLPGSEPSVDAGQFDRREFVQRFGALQQALVARLEAEPGVRGVAVADLLPRMEHATRLIELDDESAPAERLVRVAKVARVDIGFFDALGTPLLSGRAFDTNDVGAHGSAVLVNESFVEFVLGGRNPIGRRVRYRAFGQTEPSRWYEIVGVVGHAGMDIMDPDNDAGLYVPLTPGSVYPIRLAIHVGAEPEAFTPRLRAIAAEVDPNAIISSPLALNRIFEGDWYIAASVTLGGLFGVGILLALAACGIYAIMSFSVAERTREIGIRTALGAHPGQVAWTVARRSLLQLAVGAAIGTPAAWWAFMQIAEDSGSALMAFVASLLPGIGVMLVVGLAACTAPTLRALRITPTEALRQGE